MLQKSFQLIYIYKKRFKAPYVNTTERRRYCSCILLVSHTIEKIFYDGVGAGGKKYGGDSLVGCGAGGKRKIVKIT